MEGHDIMERIWEKDYGPFRVFGYVAPEDMDISEIFDEDAGYHIDGLRNDIEQGNKIWVCAYAKVYCKGIELGDHSIGGLLYKNNDELAEEVFDKDVHDLVHESLKQARASLNYLKDVKAPPREQLTSQFMEGQIW